MASQDADLSEQATPHKLTEARKKGSVSRSNDLNALAMMAALVATIFGSGWDAWRRVARLQQQMLAHGNQADWSVDGMAAWLAQMLTDMLSILGPLYLTLAVVAVLVNFFQTGPVFSFHPLIPDLNRLNPATGLKRVFSMRTLFETAKSLVKLAILGTVAYYLVRDTIPGLISLPSLEAKGYSRLLIGLVAALLVKLVLTLLFIGLLDYGFTRWEFAKRMRMSKRDVKDESKNREGDPRIRARIRELRKEVLKRSKGLSRVPSADVLITNPTRLAVALRYRHGESAAPQVVAKGAGEMARRMRTLAATHHIPIVQNKMLARTLFREVGEEGYVPEKLYPQLARIMLWVYTMRDAKRANER